MRVTSCLFFAAFLGFLLETPTQCAASIAVTAHDPSMEKLLKHFIHKHANCSRTEWACKRDCRVQFVDRTTGACRRPDRDDQCFGIPIRYNYTRDAPHIFDTLPAYSIISRFPRCWSALGPLLCAVAYRPCSNRSYFELTMTKPGVMEMWQVFRKDMCHRAVSQCPFLVDNGQWPAFVNCSHSPVNKLGRQLFSDGSCEMPYNKAPSVVERSECLWPLIYSEETYRNAHPLIDNCFMPCRSPLLSSKGLRNTLMAFVFTASLIIFTLCALCFVYTWLLSAIWQSNLCVYTLGHALLSASAHWFIWLTGFIDTAAVSAMCIADGLIRRDHRTSFTTGRLDWCKVESWLVHSSLMAAYLWLCCFVVLGLGHPPIRKDHKVYVDGTPQMSIRCVLLIVYLIAACFATLALWMDTAESDGVLGVCSVGLRSLSNASLYVYIPMLVALISALIMAAFFFIRRRYLAMVELDSKEKNAKAQENGTVPNKSPTKLQSDSGAESQAFVDSLNDEAMTEEGAEGSIQKQHIEATPPKSKRRVYIRKKDGCGYTDIPAIWIYAIVVAMLVSVLSTWLSHLSIGVPPNWERTVVMDSVRCSLNATLHNGSVDWLSATHHNDHVIGVSDPLVRRQAMGSRWLSAPGCELVTSLDDELLAMWLTFIVLPSLPFMMVVVLFISGCCCDHGLKGVNRLRANLNPFHINTDHTNDASCIGRSSLEGVELLPVWGSECGERVNKWTAGIEQPNTTRICSSANCLNTEHRHGLSIHSHTLSEPADPSAHPNSTIRRLNLLERSAERRRTQHGFSASSADISEVEARLSLAHTNTLGASASDSILHRSTPTTPPFTDIRSVYSGWSPLSASGSLNITSGSQHTQNYIQAEVLTAYEKGLLEGRYQERCNRYEDHIKHLTDNLSMANCELRRIASLSNPNPTVGETMCSPRAVDDSSAHTNPRPPQNDLNDKDHSMQPGQSSQGSGQSKTSVDERPQQSESGVGTKMESTPREMEDWHVIESDDSNMFNSDEEDSDEERFFENMMKETDGKEVIDESEDSPTESSSMDEESDSESLPGPSRNTENQKAIVGRVPQDATYTLHSLNPPHIQAMGQMNAELGRVQHGGVAGTGRPSNGPPNANRSVGGQVAVQRMVGQNPARPVAGQNGVRAYAVGGVSAAGSVILSGDQQAQLQQMRSNLSETDLLHWSEYFRRLAFERATDNNRAQMRDAQQQVQQHMHRVMSPAIEEEEEVMDPFTPQDEGGGGAGSSSGSSSANHRTDSDSAHGR